MGEKIVQTRKALMKKYRSVYFGRLSDEDLQLAGRYSKIADVHALVFRSKSALVRAALAENGAPSAYESSLALLKDKAISVRESVLQHAWLNHEDYEALCEKSGKTRGNAYCRVLNPSVISFTDCQLYHLLKNNNVSDRFFQDLDVDAVATLLVKLTWKIGRWGAAERAELKARELERVKTVFLSPDERKDRLLHRSKPALSAAQDKRLRDIERELLEYKSGAEAPNEMPPSLPTAPEKSKSEFCRTGQSKQKDRALAQLTGLSPEEFEYLIFRSRDDKTRSLAIVNPEMPYELFDRVLDEYPEEAANSTFFWVRYLEDPQFLGKPDLDRIKKLLSNDEVPSSFIAATFSRFEDGEFDRSWRRWRTTLMAIAEHPNTSEDVLLKLRERNRKDLNDRIRTHPRMQSSTKKEVKRIGRKVVRQYQESQSITRSCTVEIKYFAFRRSDPSLIFTVDQLRRRLSDNSDTVSPPAFEEECLTILRAYSQATGNGIPDLLRTVAAVTEVEIVPFFATKDRMEIRLVGCDLLAADLEPPAMSIGGYKKSLDEGVLELEFPIFDKFEMGLRVVLE